MSLGGGLCGFKSSCQAQVLFLCLCIRISTTAPAPAFMLARPHSDNGLILETISKPQIKCFLLQELSWARCLLTAREQRLRQEKMESLRWELIKGAWMGEDLPLEGVLGSQSFLLFLCFLVHKMVTFLCH